MTLSLTEARERLRQSIEEYILLEAELRALENTNFRVCIFGSARIWPEDPIYDTVFRLAQSLSERGIDVVTGGGPGLMEAANRGVLAAGKRSMSYGLTLDLPSLVEPPNPHLDIKSSHKRFSSRLDEFMRLSHAVVVAPGGIGTLLELMYVWQLLQLQTMEPRPVVLLGCEYWSGLIEWMRSMPAALRLLDLRDLDAVSLVDSPAEALEILDREHKLFRAACPPAIRSESDPPLRSRAERLTRVAEGLARDLTKKTRAANGVLKDLLTSAA